MSENIFIGRSQMLMQQMKEEGKVQQLTYEKTLEIDSILADEMKIIKSKFNIKHLHSRLYCILEGI